MHQSEFSKGLRAGLSIGIGYFPVALTFGLLAKTGGLSLIEATAMSIFVFAGAAQYISLSLLAHAVDPFMIVVNTFIVNIRHFLMSASLNEKMRPSPKPVKAAVAFGVTDETFSVIATSKEDKVSSAQALGVIAVAYGSWVSFTAAGHLIGDILPPFLQAAMSIALYALFVALLVPSMKGNRKVVLLAALAAILSCVFFYTELLSTGWSILVSTLVAAIVIELLYVKTGRSPVPPLEKEGI